jgi:putative transposase
MRKDNGVGQEIRGGNESRSALDDILREGARRMLQTAIEAEVGEYVERHAGLHDPQSGRRLVVRNGRQPERSIQSGLGQIALTKPRVDDRREGHRFTSRILPPYLRRTPSIEALIPLLYLKGISTNDFPEALSAILGPQATGLSAGTVSRLKEVWQTEHQQWARRDLSAKRYVYWWADGVYFNVRLSDERPCLLVIVGTLGDGTKELVAIWDGQRESKLSWQEVLRDLKRRGVQAAPALCVADGALGLWAAMEEEFPATRQQRCWVHKTANVLDKLPKKVQPSAKRLIHQMYLAPTRADALEAYGEFLALYGAKYPKACQCIQKDEDVLFTFYDFPAEHWRHIRTTNPIESTFATIRHRSRQTKGCGSRAATLAMVYKLAREAERSWRRLNGCEQLAKIIRGVRFEDGVEKEEATLQQKEAA